MLFLAGAALPATLLALQPWDPAARSAWWLASLVLPLAAAWYAVAAAVRGAAAFQFSLLLLVIVCAGLGEAALRVHPTSARLLRGDYAFGLHRSEYQFRPMEAPLIWPSYARTFDAFPGWRGASAGGAARIVCLGGSSTVGVGATSPALAYPAQLERMLREAGRGAVEVVNAGFLGYSSFDNWLLAARDLPALQPALVVLNFSANDGFPAWWLSRSQREVWESFRVAWEARARLPRLLASSRLLAGIFRQAGAVARPLRRHQGSLLVPPDDFERNVGEIIDRARAAGARVLLVAEPYYESTQPGEAYYSRYHDVLAGLAERRGVPLLRPSLTATEARRDKVFYDPVHPTDEGYRRIAEEIAAVIARDELLPAR